MGQTEGQITLFQNAPHMAGALSGQTDATVCSTLPANAIG